jgi:hypothetical protein
LFIQGGDDLVKKTYIALIAALIIILIFSASAWNRFDFQPKGLLYEASQDPENEAYKWWIHDYLLTPPDMNQILAEYYDRYTGYTGEYQKEFAHDQESLEYITVEWQRATGKNGIEGYVSGADLEWMGVSPSEEEMEIYNSYRGQYRAIPVYDIGLTEIVDYFLIEIR